jgi:hypothetical protein
VDVTREIWVSNARMQQIEGLTWQLRHQGKMKCRSDDDTSRGHRMGVVKLTETGLNQGDKRSFNVDSIILNHSRYSGGEHASR